MVSQLLRCHGSPGMGVRSPCCVLCPRLREGTWVDGYEFPLLPFPPQSHQVAAGVSGKMGQWLGAGTWMPTDLGSRPPSSFLSGWNKAAVRSSATRGLPGAHAPPPRTKVQGPLICRTLKNSRGPRGKRSLGAKEEGVDWPGEALPQDLPPPSLPVGDAGAQVSEWHQPPGQDPSPRGSTFLQSPTDNFHSLGLCELCEQAPWKQGSEASWWDQTPKLEALPQPTPEPSPGSADRPLRIHKADSKWCACDVYVHTCTRTASVHSVHTHARSVYRKLLGCEPSVPLPQGLCYLPTHARTPCMTFAHNSCPGDLHIGQKRAR